MARTIRKRNIGPLEYRDILGHRTAFASCQRFESNLTAFSKLPDRREPVRSPTNLAKLDCELLCFFVFVIYPPQHDPNRCVMCEP